MSVYTKNAIVLKLLEINAIQFGKFKLKSGVESNVYIDLRRAFTDCLLRKSICMYMYESIEHIQFDYILGVPYGGVPYAQTISEYKCKHSEKSSGPGLLLMRKTPKLGHGNSNEFGIEGDFSVVSNQRKPSILLVEDTVTSGKSLMEAVEKVEKAGFQVAGTVCFLYRGDKEHLQNLPNLHYTIDLGFLMSMTKIPGIIKSKKSRLVVSLDIEDTVKLVQIASQVAGYVAGFKLHMDQYDETQKEEIYKCMTEIKKQTGVFLIEDRKYADIGSTTYKQLKSLLGGVPKLFDYITVHSVPGDSVLLGVQRFNKEFKTDIKTIVVTEMSCNQVSQNYQKNAIELGHRNEEMVVGFVGQKRPRFVDTGYIWFTPGVSLSAKNDTLGQKYRTPEECLETKSDILIVGRDITNSSDCLKRCIEYNKICFPN